MRPKVAFSALTVPNVTKGREAEAMVAGGDIVSYGADNNFPAYLWTMYTQSPTHQSIVDGKVDYICGGGVAGDFGAINSKGETIAGLLHKVAMDKILFGGFAIQVVFNKLQEITDLFWVDFSKLRTNRQGDRVYFRNDWASHTEMIEYDIFDLRKANKTSPILYYRGLNCRSIYPLPSYFAALNAIETEGEVQTFHLSSIRNNFAASAVIQFNNGVPSDEEREQIEEQINAKFSGASNAAKLLIMYNESPDTKTIIDRLETDNFDERFGRLGKDTQRNIFIAHRVTSPSLFGVVPENTGFTRQEYVESFEVFNKTVIQPQQREITEQMRRIFPDREFSIKPFISDSETFSRV